MSSGLFSGKSGLSVGQGLYRVASSLWSGASGFVTDWDGNTTPAWLPTGALTFIDFENGHYYANGAERAFGDMFREVDNGWWDPSYQIDPADIVANEGWYGPDFDASPNTCYGILSLDALAGWWEPGVGGAWSAVVDLSASHGAVDLDRAAFLLYLAPPDTETPATVLWFFKGIETVVKHRAEVSVGNADDTDHYIAANPNSASTRLKLAGTLNTTTGHIAASEAGGGPATGTASGGSFTPDYAAMSMPYLLAYTGGDATMIVHSLTIYPEQSDAALAVLSA